MLYRELAPISEDAWKEIDERAEEVLKSYLSARKVVKVLGPKGMDFNVISEGRLVNIKEEDKVCFGTYHVQPLIEARVEFELKRWEIDNINRGAKDIEYEPLEAAAKRLALFEEDVIFNGLEEGGIRGLDPSFEGEEFFLGNDSSAILGALSRGVVELRKAYQKGPFDLVVSEEVHQKILSLGSGYPFNKRVEELIGGKIIFNHIIKGAYLLPHDSEDLELTLGRDFSIGYQAHDIEKVRFFITESFTFRVLDPSLIVKFNL